MPSLLISLEVGLGIVGNVLQTGCGLDFMKGGESLFEYVPRRAQRMCHVQGVNNFNASTCSLESLWETESLYFSGA